ncbi:DnaB-like helicase N-terminal domain-containing protein, partial [Tumebacillus flagellatus]
MSEQHEETQKPELPHHIESEQATLGAILLDPNAIHDVRDILEVPEQFHEPKHSTIYKAILELADAGEPVDVVTLSKHLSDNGRIESVGGVAYLAMLSNSVPTAANVDFYAETVLQKWRARELIKASQEQAAALMYGDDIEEVLEKADRR